MKTKIRTITDGSGYWSDRATYVNIHKIGIGYVNGNNTFGELRAYFSTDDWDPTEDGLIYTDHQWMVEFKEGLEKLGFSQAAINSVSYSEQGMQGYDYVSMDIGKEFIAEWIVKNSQPA